MAEAGNVVEAVGTGIAALGGLDGFVHCAGIFDHRSAAETSVAQWQHVIDINLTAAFAAARSSLDALAETGGAIVMVSSQIGIVGHPPRGGLCREQGGFERAGEGHGPRMRPARYPGERGCAWADRDTDDACRAPGSGPRRRHHRADPTRAFRTPRGMWPPRSDSSSHRRRVSSPDRSSASMAAIRPLDAGRCHAMAE